MARAGPNTKDQTPYLAIRRCNTSGDPEPSSKYRWKSFTVVRKPTFSNPLM